MPGPVPKRSEERIRRNKPEVEITRIEAVGEVTQPDLGLLGDVHPMVEDMWWALGESAQSKFYEPSDWEFARFTLHFANTLLLSGRPSAQLLGEVNKMCGDLLFSEGARRKVRMEVERNAKSAEVIDVADEIKRRLQAQGAV